MFTDPEWSLIPWLAPSDITALLLSIKLAALSTLLLLLIAIPAAWLLTRAPKPVKILAESTIALPLVLPPTVLGYYLLLAFAPHSWLGGSWHQLTGTTLSFSFSGLMLGSVLYSLPFVAQPIFNAFERIPKPYIESAMNLGASNTTILHRIALPLCKRSILMGAGLGFAHTLGEFGVVLMIGGNIPGETQVVAIQLYDHVESLAYDAANRLALTLLGASFALLLLCYSIHYSTGSSPPCSTQK